jgi:2-methylcitrate dehydratase PrpD
MTGSTIAERLAIFAAGLGVGALPRDVERRAKACLLHGLAVGMAGSAARFGQRAELTSPGFERKPDSSGYARSLLSGRWHPATSAAFINGVHLHARAQEDTHGTFHPGVSVIPAVLAAAETADVDGATILAAVVAGYEVGIALSDPLTELTTPPFRATAVFGAVAAAGGAGRIRGLDTEQMVSALSIAAAMSGGTSESFGAGTDEWHFQSGAAAATGLRAAQLAAAGVIGSPTAFEAGAGFLDCFASNPQSAEAIASDLGHAWNILGVTFKPYPVCAFNQAPAMLAARLHASGVRAGAVASIQLCMNEREATYPGMPWRGPFTSTSQSLMSARFAFATALATGDITYDSLQDYTNPQVLELISRINLVPEARRQPKTARATITLSDGSTVDDNIEDSDALLSWDMDGVIANARRLAAEAALTPAGFANLVETIESVERMPTLDPLIEAAMAGTCVAV